MTMTAVASHVRAPKLPSLVWSVTERLQLANGIYPNGKDPYEKSKWEEWMNQMRRAKWEE